MSFTVKEILNQLDLAFGMIPSSYYPKGNPLDIKYNFFLDLEHGYCMTAGSSIHLYADDINWAIVFEKSGYQKRGYVADIELDYIGNCITYQVNKYVDRNYITNASNIIVITYDEFEKIRNKSGSEMEQFELISPEATEVMVRDIKIKIEQDHTKYETLGIELREFANPRKLIGFDVLVRYLHETNPNLIKATENEIKKHITSDLPKILTLNEFNYVSTYEENIPPSEQETFQLIANILVTKDTTLWKPTQNANNHWKNWVSGHL